MRRKMKFIENGLSYRKETEVEEFKKFLKGLIMMNRLPDGEYHLSFHRPSALEKLSSYGWISQLNW